MAGQESIHEDPELVREFLIESAEHLARLDNELVQLEARPRDADLLAGIFRSVHTIKGTCGFLGYTTLQAITHEAETILSELRAGRRDASPDLISLILEVIDATRAILRSIETTGKEGANSFANLIERLQFAAANTPAKPEPAPGAAAAEPGQSAVCDSAIRVDVGLLDKLMNLVGELVLARNQILQYQNAADDSALSATSQRLNLITTELQEGVMKTRMQPIGMVWSKLPRVVRDIAHALGKQISVAVEGAGTELDRTIIEAIKDPMLHLVRNACGHGIELPEVRVKARKPAQGRVMLRAWHEGGQVNIEISDDGGGIDPAKIRRKAFQQGLLRREVEPGYNDREILNFIFKPGFSTAEQVTSISGRGVGMDVVKSSIEKIGGQVDLASTLGEGTTVRLKIPLTLAIIPGLVVTSGGERFVIPQASLLELVRLEGEAGRGQIEQIQGARVYRRRGTLLPIACLNEVLGLACDGSDEVIHIVVLQSDGRQFGVVVDGIQDTQEIVVKPLSRHLKGLSMYAGATIMGDGRVALILDVAGIGQSAGLVRSASEPARAAGEKKEAVSEAGRLLLFRAASFGRIAVPLSLVARLEEFAPSAIEQAGGRRVVQYRGRILPLISLGGMLDSRVPDTSVTQDPVPVIVFGAGEQSIGLLVDEILDITESAVTCRKPASHPALLGSAVVGGRVTDFLDLHAVLAHAGERFDGAAARSGKPGTILLAENSQFSRALLRGALEMAGYRVIECADAAEALRAAEHQRPDLLVAAQTLPPAGAPSLVEQIRRRHGLERLPALTLTTGAESPHQSSGGEFDDCQAMFDWDAMVESLRRLSGAIENHTAQPEEAGHL
ncbi:MAG TPA: chemotaxis protein CheW [Bryobacteraceae bacterium]|nr:chemotaxis protein CheW [Bryobacteraceae bacterium]